MVFFIYFCSAYEIRQDYVIIKKVFMARAMFEYTKTILKKVSFNKELFSKELEKAIQRLLPHEIKELTIWLKKYIMNKPELYVCMNIIDK